jgi:methylmalonyl-CoA mutase N-terminal domain/subunit
MRMFAGFGTPEQTNERFKYLLAQGQTGLSTAFDFPTLMGYDSDSPLSLGEVGMCGVAVDTLRDMEILFDGIPLDQVTTSMTINGPAIVLLCFYVALADSRGIPRSKAIGGTVQNDCLKEFIAQHAWVVPPAARDAHRHRHHRVLRRRGAALEPGVHQRLPHPRGGLDGGAGAGLHARRRLGLRGVGVARPRRRRLRAALSFFFDVHNDFFEEIAKFRAARRMWARMMKERFGAKDPRS